MKKSKEEVQQLVASQIISEKINNLDMQSPKSSFTTAPKTKSLDRRGHESHQGLKSNLPAKTRSAMLRDPRMLVKLAKNHAKFKKGAA